MNTVKAGPGTVYIQYGTTELSNPPKILTIEGDSKDAIQRQTKTQITGNSSADFVYDKLELNGN